MQLRLEFNLRYHGTPHRICEPYPLRDLGVHHIMQMSEMSTKFLIVGRPSVLAGAARLGSASSCGCAGDGRELVYNSEKACQTFHHRPAIISIYLSVGNQTVLDTAGQAST